MVGFVSEFRDCAGGWSAVLSISPGHSADYLTGAVATGRENYYTGAVAAGEPPGRWYGRGAASLGLAGEVDAQDMTALYEHFLDPREEGFSDPERWADAATLGHTGRRYLSEEEIYQASLAAEPDADAERRAELQVEAGKRARKNVTFLDATFSVQKSITVLHAGFEAREVKARRAYERARSTLGELGNGNGTGARGAPVSGAPVPGASASDVGRLTAELEAAEREAEAFGALRRAVEDAIWAGNQAAMEYLSTKAGVSRVGHHGGAAGRWVDAHDWTVASFFQHDSRNHDPQLHIHNAILNRVQGLDGKWRTLDSKAMHKFKSAAAAVGERVMEHYLTQALAGVEFATRPDGKAREIVGVVQAAIDKFSSRRFDITAATRPLVEAFKAHHGREPNALELDHLQRQATFATRRAKSHDGETMAERLERWDAELRAAVAGGLDEVVENVLARADAAAGAREPVRWSPREVIETSTSEIRQTKAGWHEGDLLRSISNALPDYLGDLDADQITCLLDGLTAEAIEVAAIRLDADRPGDEALPDDLRRADGTSVYEAPGSRLYATPDQVRSERLLAAASAESDAPALSSASVEAFLSDLDEWGIGLGADQTAAVRGVLSSGARVETLVGPAGTGKSFVVGTIAKAWQDETLWDGQRRRVVGLASSQIAADVLAGEGLDSHNITRWLNAQDRLTRGSTRPKDISWALNSGDLVVVDESAMANTADLARIHAVCRGAEAKLLLCGDHRQLAAVGGAGGMELVAGSGIRHELSETRRFTEGWEGPASLRLRERDQTVLDEYHKHGRLVDGGAAEQTHAAARDAWLADTLAGRRSVLIVDTNDQAAVVSAALRAKLVDLGHVQEEGAVRLGLQGTYAGRGDLVQARRNAWNLAGYEGNRRGPINRETFRVVDTGGDGSLIVTPADRGTDGEQPGERLTLPASYVAEHVALGYASTVHAAQGLTVDTSHTIVTPRTGADALYVGMSRGREANTAYVVTRPVGDDAPTGEVNQTVHRSPRSMVAGLFDSEDPQLSALAEAAESAAEAAKVRTPAELFRDGVERATATRARVWLDELAADGTLTEQQRDKLAAEDGAATLNTLLRRVELAGGDPKQRLTDAVQSRDLDDARQLTSVLHARIAASGDLDPVGDTYTDRIPHVDDPQYRTYLATLAATADERRDELGCNAVAEAPQWAVEALGPVPADEAERDVWQTKAGVVAAHRELMGHDEPDDALGPAPTAGQVEEYASWRSAWRALGRPEADRAEAEMSTGQLRIRVRAYEREKTWAPAYVANELAGTRQAADKHGREATVRRAEADQATDPDRRADLLQHAEEADSLAATLDEQAAVLDEADLARGEWYVHTAATRDAASRAQAELSAREVDDADAADGATADEWLEAHAAAGAEEDAYREIHDDHELADIDDQRGQDLQAVGLDKPPAEAPEPAPVDIREETADVAPDDDQHDAVRVPTADETADSVDRARRAVRELHHRTAVEEERDAEEARNAELATWHARDDSRTAETGHDTAEPTVEDGPPVLELSPYDD